MSSPTEPHAWSLRRRVLLLTSLATATAWLVGGTAMYLIERHVSGALLDQRLQDIGSALLTVADHEGAATGAGGGVRILGAQTVGQHYRYQIWSRAGALLAASVDTPRTPFVPYALPGFANVTVEGEALRVVVMPSDDGERRIEVAEPLSGRNAGLESTLAYLAAPLVLSLLVLVGVSGWLVRRATSALQASARQLTQRTPDDLRPVHVDNPPAELTPIVDAINSLFSRFESALAVERRFTSAAAHELRTPLAAIKVQAQVALLTSADADRRAALERLMPSIDNAAHMIDQLLTISRIDSVTALRTQATRLQLDAVAAHVIDELRPMAERRRQSIVEDLGPADILGLDFGIAVLLRNLLENALRYGPDGGTVRVRTMAEGKVCVASVEDAGPGIAPELRARVFERFYRIPGSTSSDGCGIGLSIVQAVVEMHRGQIELGSSDLGGLQVTVRFASADSTTAARYFAPSVALPTRA